MSEQTSEPHTMAWEWRKKYSSGIVEPKLTINNPKKVPENEVDWRPLDISELIRRSDAKEYYRKKERQRIKSEVKDKIWSNLTQEEMFEIIEGEN